MPMVCNRQGPDGAFCSLPVGPTRFFGELTHVGPHDWYRGPCSDLRGYLLGAPCPDCHHAAAVHRIDTMECSVCLAVALP